MKADRSMVIFAAFVLAIVCLMGIFLFTTTGMGIWGLTAIRERTAIARGSGPVPATPVQPVQITPTGGAKIEPTAAAPTVEQPGGGNLETVTLTPPVGIQPSVSPFLEASPVSSLLAPGSLDAGCIPLNRPSVRAQVRRVLDGATIEVEEGGQVYEVSYIGVNPVDPAENEAGWIRASEKNAELVDGKTVLLIQDRTEQDPLGRRPRYVIASGVFVNLEMIRSGYGIAVDQPPDLSCSVLLLEAEQAAVAASLGLWLPDPTATRILIPLPTPTVATTGPMVITAIARRGTIWQEPEEFVEFRNDSADPIQLEGWTLQDNERHVFTFPTFVLGPRQYCRVYTNQYRPTSCGFTYASPSPIWNNDTDCAYMKDPYGNLISTFCYGFQ